MYWNRRELCRCNDLPVIETVVNSLDHRAPLFTVHFPFQVVEEVGRHITFRYEGVLPLADQDLLALLDILVNKADIMQV